MTNQNNNRDGFVNIDERQRIQHELSGGGDDTNPEFLFSTTHTTLLQAIDAGLIDANSRARLELARRGLGVNGEPRGEAAAETAVADIAHRLLHLDTIETRNADAHDFHVLAVWSIREALMAAFNAGAKATGNGHATGED